MSNSAKVQKTSLFANSHDFNSVVKEVSLIVNKLSGIQLGEKQFAMVENRVKSRMVRLGLGSAPEYLQYLKAHLEQESMALLSLITTHHTYFFREFTHFDFLIREGLKNIIEGVRARGDRKLRVWSSACSRGQEVYTLAMFLSAHLPQMAPEIDFEIYGTDVDPESVNIAQNGVYAYKELKQVPAFYLGSHWVKGTGAISEFAKVKSTLRSKCHFSTFNLVSPGAMPYPGQFDLVFCRNVFIYFNPEQIKKSSEHQIKTLAPHGYFFIGISETLNGLKVDSEYVGPSVYRQAQPKSAKPVLNVVQPQTTGVPVSMPAPKLAPKPVPLLRVLCVDDSSSILTLLKRILSKENGFEVVATATNGREAFDVLKTQSFDLITLDIHMPEMDGLTFLEKSKGMLIPPVLMISSVNRENSTTALRALELGAADYVEKPTMANLAERGDEIRAKLLTISLAKTMPVSGLSALDQSFKKEFKITEPAKKLRVGFFGLGDKKKMSYFIKNNSPKDPPAIFAVEGAPEALKGLSEQLKAERAIEIKLDLNNLKPGDVALVDFKENADKLKALAGQLKTSVVVTGVPTQKVCDFVLQLSSIHLYLEDLGPYSEAAQKSLLDVASFKAPLTSYFSVSEEYFD